MGVWRDKIGGIGADGRLLLWRDKREQRGLEVCIVFGKRNPLQTMDFVMRDTKIASFLLCKQL